jgi:hypothetical protein
MGNREKQKDDSRQESASKPAPGAAVGVSHQPASNNPEAVVPAKMDTKMDINVVA